MELTSVTLDEVFAAAHGRAASLVPETSGYLALAVADASARLPFSIEDPMVLLTSEGTVKVARGTQVLAPEESARRMRDMLSRLLECSAGSMPALAATARPRTESADGVESFIRELEAALVPVNRAAARRALARLARETARAKDLGRLRRRRRPAPAAAQQQPTAPAAPAVAPAAPAPVAPPTQPEAARTSPVEEPSVEVEFTPPPLAPSEPVGAPTSFAVEAAPVEQPPPAPAPVAQVAVASSALDAPEAEPTPIPEEPPTVIDAAVAPISEEPEAAPQPRKRRSPESTAALGATQKSEVEDLLDRFVVSTLSSPESMRQARASLKRLAGLDPTPPPPAVEEIRRLTAALESSARAKRAEAPEPIVVPAPPPRQAFRAGTIAVALIALLAAGLLGHYLPRLLASAEVPDRALTRAPSQ
ncbi:MAG: hypothetical protein JNL21_01840 [Myxococcales bacterium]|nr:hypothetical protein [Myxococcales bacterium]